MYRKVVDPEATYGDEILRDHAGETYRGEDGMQRAWDRALEALKKAQLKIGSSGRGALEIRSCPVTTFAGEAEAAASRLSSTNAYLWKLREGRVI